jgi:predicted regulator of Ras-like GTPase activity (Roadblock/LC7/MglB family)
LSRWCSPTHIKKAFLDAYPGPFSGPGLNVSKFSNFSGKLYEAISGATSAILQDLQSVRGITNALVVCSDGTQVTAGSEEDQLAIVANLQPVTTIAHDIMAAKKDRAKLITIAMSRQNVFVLVLGDQALVTICRKKAGSELMAEIKKSGRLISQVYALADSLVS